MILHDTEILCSTSGVFVYYKEDFYYTGACDVLINKLGKICAAELPGSGLYFAKGEIFGFLESKNAGFELIMPVSGKIEAVNQKIKENPGIINLMPMQENWLIKISSDFYEQDKKDLIGYNQYKKEAGIV